MSDILKGIGITLSILITIIAIGWVMGLNKIFYTKIIGKEQQNVEREVFEQTQSYVEGKRQEAGKLYREYMSAPDDERAAIATMVGNNFANFDEQEYLDGEIQRFVYVCKMGGKFN